MNYLPLLLGFMDKIEEWNDKLNTYAGNHMDNVLIGCLIIGVLLVCAFAGINTLNKK